MSYKYETHLHTYPVSKCAQADVRSNLEFYKTLGYDGVFVTNHFLDGNVNVDRNLPYEEKIDFYCSDYRKAKHLEKEMGIKVFFGIEMSLYWGTDFLVFGLDEDWLLAHADAMDLPPKEKLEFLRSEGALVAQAHPYREAFYIDHIRLLPRSVQAVETINASNTDQQNLLADFYAKQYGLIAIAGSDNHCADKMKTLAGVEFDKPICSEKQFVEEILKNSHRLFSMKNPLATE